MKETVHTNDEPKQTDPCSKPLDDGLVKDVSKLAHLSTERGKGEDKEEHEGEGDGDGNECGRRCGRRRQKVWGVTREEVNVWKMKRIVSSKFSVNGNWSTLR